MSSEAQLTMTAPHGLAIEPAREAPIDMPTKSALPHFGIMANTLRGCLEFDAFDSAVLSERTRRTIAAGDRVNPDTWEEYSNEIFTILVSLPIYPLDEGDRQSLVRAFQSLRSTYEQLSEMLSRHNAPPDAVYRGVMRLQFLDFGLRYFALCQLNNFTPTEGLPLWAQQDGANKFWRAALEETFPGIPLVGSGNKTGDCASQLKMNPSKMRRCLYENDIPDLATLKCVFPTPEALGKALRHYAAFRLYRITDKFRRTSSRRNILWTVAS